MLTPAPASSPVPPLLEARGISKRYGNVVALMDVAFEVMPGECVALVGDNGAGKSTLVKILSGAVPADHGEIRVAGDPIVLRSPIDARKAGIETVYQDLALAQTLDSPANIYLGREIPMPGLLGRLGFVDKKAMRVASKAVLAELNVTIKSVRTPISALSGGQRQGVAIARAVARNQRVLFLDEPTAALGVRQTKVVMDLIKRLITERGESIGIVLITHDLPRVFEVANRIIVLRHGRRVSTRDTADITVEHLVASITGARQ